MKALGQKPKGKNLAAVEKSKFYVNGTFKNINVTPQLKEGVSMFAVGTKLLLKKKPDDIKPPKPVPSLKTDLTSIQSGTPTIVWFGHSSYLIKHLGKTVLVDPVFSGHASPVSMFVKAFDGANTYGVNEMPFIDMLVITHDHYDHLDYETVLALKAQNKIGHVYTALGVGSHLESWGFSSDMISEFEWWQGEKVSDRSDGSSASGSLRGIEITATPARHFSGRDLQRDKTLWASFVLRMGEYKFFIGGDSGYDDQFKVIGEKFGPFDIVFLECGQYGENWPYIHMFPEQTAQAAKDLGAKILFPVHWGKFILSDHAWNASIERVGVAAGQLGVRLTTPKIGEQIVLDKVIPNGKWWLD